MASNNGISLRINIISYYNINNVRTFLKIQTFCKNYFLLIIYILYYLIVFILGSVTKDIIIHNNLLIQELKILL